MSAQQFKAFLSLTLSVFLFVSVFGQETALRFNHYSSENGLSDNRVKCFVQDNNGFIWIGTNDGLNRFDGKEFIVFKSKRADRSSICGNSISDIDIDENGKLWIATEDNGFCSLDPQTLSFQNYRLSKDDRVRSRKIISLKVLSPDSVYLALNNSIATCFLVKSNRLIDVEEPYDLSGASYDLEKNAKGELLCAGISGGIRTIKNNELVGNSKKWNDQANMGPPLNDLFIDSSEMIWAGGWNNALYKNSTKKEDLIPYTLDNTGVINRSINQIKAINEIDMNTLLIGTDNDGLYVFDKFSKLFSRVDNDQNDRNASHGRSINEIYKDDQNRLWIGSSEGVHIYDPLLNQFEIHKIPEFEGAKIYSLLSSDDELIISSVNGIAIESKTDGSRDFKKIFHKGELLKPRKLLRSEDGEIYLTSNRKVVTFNKETFDVASLTPSHIENRSIDLNNLSGSTFNDIFEYSNSENTYLNAFAYGYGLAVLNTKTRKQFTLNITHQIGEERHSESFVRKFLVDSKGQLWACGKTNGLIKVEHAFNDDSLRTAMAKSADGKFGLKSTFYSTNEGMPSHDVFDLVEDKDGTYWITTIGNGLIHYDPNAKVQFNEIETEYRTIHGIEIDENRNLWMVTSKGILFYNTKENRFKLYDKIDGIPLNGLVGYWYKDDDGTLFKGANGYYIKFKPENIRSNTYNAPTFLTHILVNNNLSDSLLVNTEIDLKHDQNFVTFNFASPNYTDPKRNKFQYLLEGVDPEWKTIQNDNEAVYTSLPPGEYPFKIRSSNNDGKWGEMQTLTSISVLPPWWKTWWFYSILVLALTTFLFALYRYRIAQVVRFYEMRDRIARDLHDDIGSTLGSISLYSEVAEQQLRKTGSSAAEDVVHKIGDTSREMMDSIGDIVWAVNPKNDKVSKIAERMKNFAVPLLKARGIDVSFHIDEALLKEKLKMEKRKNMFLIFKEAIHNALKYSKCKHMHIALERSGKDLNLRIEDDGIGFDQDNNMAYNGNGMINMQERAKAMKGKMSIFSEENKGTKISVAF